MDQVSSNSAGSDMVMAYLWRLEAGLREKALRAEENQRDAEERLRRATADRRSAMEDLEHLRLLKAALGMADDGADWTSTILAGNDIESPAVAQPDYVPGTIIGQTLGPYFWALQPDRDEETGDPVYDVRVVSGKRNSRERALAAARVYGGSLREQSLADAIFLTGETRAAGPASIRGSLGGLVRHGSDWRREHGQLIYQGDGLRPDRDTILLLARERDALKQRAREAEGDAQLDS